MNHNMTNWFTEFTNLHHYGRTARDSVTFSRMWGKSFWTALIAVIRPQRDRSRPLIQRWTTDTYRLFPHVMNLLARGSIPQNPPRITPRSRNHTDINLKPIIQDMAQTDHSVRSERRRGREKFVATDGESKWVKYLDISPILSSAH